MALDGAGNLYIADKSNNRIRLLTLLPPPPPPSTLTAVGGNGQVVLRWDAPASNGGPAIRDYEYRIDGRNPWISIGSTLTTHTVTDLVNGTAYVFEVRAVNRIGQGRASNQAEATPTAPPPPPGGGGAGGGGGGGGGGPRTSAPGAPRYLMAVGGDGEVVLTWDAPASDGGAEITDYEYRIDRRNPWISTGSTETTHTVTGLVNDAAYTFEVRAVNRIGKSRASNQTEATPVAPEVFTLDFAHFANGDGTTSDLVFVNVGTQPVRPALYFYNTEGAPVSAESVVEVTGDLEIAEDGGLTVLTEIEPLGVLTISTHGQGEVVTGSVKVISNGPIGGMLRYNLPAIGEAVVEASPPVSDALFPVRRLEGGITTGVALHNLGEEAMGSALRLDARGRAARLREHPSGGQRANVLAYRCCVPRRRYVRLHGVGALRRTRQGNVHRNRPGNGPGHPHLHDPAVVSCRSGGRWPGGGPWTLRISPTGTAPPPIWCS